MSERAIVIVGGGIIGCSCAYYLTHHPKYDRATTSVTVVEACDVAGGASGKAGGLIAQWAFPDELVAVSFPEHVRLAELHDGTQRWGWRVVSCGQWAGHAESLPPPRRRAAARLPDDLHWMRPDLTDAYESFEGQTAQVHPRLFTQSMLALAQEKGTTLVKGTATTIDKDGNRVTGVRYSPEDGGEDVTLPATHILVAAGPWTPSVIPRAPIAASRAHSITIQPAAPLSAHCVFSDIALPGRSVNPEIYARPDGEAYVCGSTDDEPLPARSTDVIVDKAKCDVLFEQVSQVSKELGGGRVLVRQACYLPSASTGSGPILGAVPGTSGLYVAAGHTCWGVCNAPGTGKVMSELILDGKITSARLTKLDPKRFF